MYGAWPFCRLYASFDTCEVNEYGGIEEILANVSQGVKMADKIARARKNHCNGFQDAL